MHRSALRILLVLCAGGLTAVLVAACGGGSSSSGSNAKTAAPSGAKKGGTLTVLANADVDYIDCGAAYYQFSYQIEYTYCRPLYSYKPQDKGIPSPDVASGPAQVSKDGKTVTVHMKSGIKFGPPVNREVTSKDVKYAIERGFNKNVANGYASAYFGNVEGADQAAKKADGEPIDGIVTPDDHTIVFKLTKSTGTAVAEALGLPLSTPVPPEYAKPMDQQNPSTYGNHIVSTGPYMITNDKTGKLTGYEPMKNITLVRNPNWDPKTDYRPAYVDKINVKEGVDPDVGSRQIVDGQSLVNGDFTPPPAILKQVATSKKDQLLLIDSGGGRFMSFNFKVPPFNDINIRKAVIAGMDRNALRLTRGGAVIGPIMQHQIPPGLPGFDEAGGQNPPAGADWLQHPTGDKTVMAKYFKAAGMSSGKYEGNAKILVVGDDSGVGGRAAEVAASQLQDMGFSVNFRQVPHSTMYTKFCNVPKAAVAFCPNTGWFKDFFDSQTLLDPTFNGANILQENNSNWPQMNDPTVNKLLDQAKVTVGRDARAKLFAQADQKITMLAPNVPWVWDKQPNIVSKNVAAVGSSFNATVDLNFTSIK
ncbi:MAG TPA: ABC transporter substrate-binding protein [Solirubrobacteraceae bacterium]|nr:ABC transporter substrate-binding protein [Solirubrobacteraceae bacterium]